jgi:hypothetical protein
MPTAGIPFHLAAASAVPDSGFPGCSAALSLTGPQPIIAVYSELEFKSG